MLLSQYIALCDSLESTTSSLEKIHFLSKYSSDPHLLSLFTLPTLNIGEKTIISALSRTTGYTEEEIITEKIFSGRLSETVHHCLTNRKIKKLSQFFSIDNAPSRDPEIQEVYISLLRLSRKTKLHEQFSILNDLFSLTSSPHLINLILSDRAIGVQKNILLKSIPADYETLSKAYSICNNWFTLLSNLDDLNSIQPKLYSPVSPHLCQSTTINAVPDEPYDIEVKYDGVRIQGHYSADSTSLYTRNLQNVTKSFPDVEKTIKNFCASNFIDTAILDTEIIPYTFIKGVKTLLDQKEVITRLRKHEVRKHMNKVHLQVILFDIIMLNDHVLIDTPHRERKKTIDEFNYTHDIIPPVAWYNVQDKSTLSKFFHEAIVQHEGIILKSPNSPYLPGSRKWFKVKPLLPSFDLVVTKAFYGNGQNANLYSSFQVSAISPDDDLIPICNVGNFKLADMKELTNTINKNPHERTSASVTILNPSTIIEILSEKVNVINNVISLDFPKCKQIRKEKCEITTTTEIITHHQVKEDKL